MTKRQWSPRSLKLPEITFLAEKIEALPQRERLYARSLIAQAMRRGTLSDKQLRAVARLAATLKPTVKRGEAHTG
jgi:hypothetical protein